MCGWLRANINTKPRVEILKHDNIIQHLLGALHIFELISNGTFKQVPNRIYLTNFKGNFYIAISTTLKVNINVINICIFFYSFYAYFLN